MQEKYEKQEWKNLPDKSTPITAERLNHMEDGIYNAFLSGSGGIEIGTEMPTDPTINLWINPDESQKQKASQVVNSMVGNEIDKSPSVDSVKKYVDKANTYSTDEIVIGTYLGKPLYRKVLRVPTTKDENGWSKINISNLNIDIIKSCNGFANLRSNLGTGFQPIPRIVTDAMSSYGIGIGDLTKSEIRIQYGTKYTTIISGELTIEYTKTTNEEV